MWEELEKALAWYTAAPSRWLESRQQDLSAAAEWLWTVIQGDFAEDQSTAQVVTGTVISMIPFVDQLCDVRDLVANCRKIGQDSEDSGAWLALVLTLLGLFPCLGSFAKGCFKILFAYGRKGIYRAGTKAVRSDLWKATQPSLEAGIQKLNGYLDQPEVKKMLVALKIDNPYQYLAGQARKLSSQVNVGQLLKAMDGCISILNDLAGMVRKWGGTALASKVVETMKSVARVRKLADQKLGEWLHPIQHWVDCLARRLEVEVDMNYRAYTNVLNPHAFKRPSLQAEIEAMENELPAYVDKSRKVKYKGMSEPDVVADWPDIGRNAPSPMKNAYETFHEASPVELSSGTVLYRVVDPGSFDNSICWMTKEEFDKLSSKNDWRRRFAVWVNWNRNGEYVTYTVPPGKPLKAWIGPAASQALDPSKDFVLEGGGIQVVLDPKNIDSGYLGRRQPTSWGYEDLGESLNLVGVPVLRNGFRSE